MQVTAPPFTEMRTSPAPTFFWPTVIGLFFVVHVTRNVITDFAADLSPGILYYIPSVKGMLFLFSVVILLHPAVNDSTRILRDSDKHTLQTTITTSVIVALLLMLLAFHLGNDSMGQHYARRSVSPFDQDTGWYNKRLLMPAIAHIFFFRDGWLYYAFSTLAFLLFLAVLYCWLRTRTDLKPWQFFSLSTCSFVIFQYQFPGYPDVLVFTFFVLVMTPGFSQKTKLCFLVLALVTHESSIFIAPFLAYRYLDCSGRLRYLAVLIIYGTIWAAAYGFDFQALFRNHNAGGRSGLEWVLIAPESWALGVFIAFKAVWILFALGTFLAVQYQLYKDAIFIAGCVSAALLVTFLGVDTSRHMAIAFPGVLVALEAVRHHLRPAVAHRVLSTIFLVNILTPSFYVGLNTGIVLRPGLYEQLYLIFSWRDL